MPMTFLESLQVCVAKYSDFNGRATRAEYWWCLLAVLIGSFAASTVNPALCVLFQSVAVTCCRHEAQQVGLPEFLHAMQGVDTNGIELASLAILAQHENGTIAGGGADRRQVWLLREVMVQ